MTSLGLCLLWSALQATLIAVVAIVLVARPWRLGGAFTPLAALLAIAMLTLCSLLPLPGWWPVTRIARAPQRTTSEVATSTKVPVVDAATAPSVAATPPTAPLPHEQSALIDLATTFMDELKSVRAEDDLRWRQSSVPAWVVGVFALGIAIGLVKLMLGVAGAREIRRKSPVIREKHICEMMDVLQAELALKQQVELRQANELATAATIGYFSPVILLPSHWQDWQDKELRAVLAHELAHIHRRDFAAQLCAQFGLILHFYNPIVHWLSERMKLEQELAADATAARLSGGQRDYLRVLATLAIDHQNHSVGWPARAFLPTRNSLLRRLEMLRVSKALSAGPSLPGRLCVLAVITVLTMALITLRPEASLPTAQASGGPAMAGQGGNAEETEVAQETTNTSSNYELRYLSEDVELVAGARPAELLKSPQLKSVLDTFGKNYTRELKQSQGFDVEEVDQIIFGLELQPETAGSMSMFVKLTKPRKICAEMVNGKMIDISGQAAIEMPQGLVLWQPDDRSVVMNTRAHIEKFIANRFTPKAFTTSKAWEKLSQEDAFVLVSGKLARSQWEAANARRLPSLKSMASSVGIIVDEAAYVGLGSTLKSEIRMAMFLECQDDTGLKRVQAATNAVVSELKNTLREVAQTVEGSAKAAANQTTDVSPENSLSGQLIGFARKALDKIQSQSDGNLLTLGTRMSEGEFPGEFLSKVTGAARRAAGRQTSMLNLRQLGMAIHSYHEANAALPQSAITVPTTKVKVEPRKYPYSWRVAILPWLEQKALYNKYKFDEPWDSPSNLEVLKQMPTVYRHPDEPADSTNTSYVILVGETTMFPPGRLAKLADINDGTANTIMVMEAKTSIPWTKPEDLEYAPDKPLPQLGGYASEGYNVLFADGTVRYFSKTLDESLLRKLITAQGGEQLK